MLTHSTHNSHLSTKYSLGTLTRTGLELPENAGHIIPNPSLSQGLTGSAKGKDDLGGLQGSSIAGRNRVTPRNSQSSEESWDMEGSNQGMAPRML